MSARKFKRKMIKELGIEKFSDVVKRKLKAKHEKASGGGIRPDKT